MRHITVLAAILLGAMLLPTSSVSGGGYTWLRSPDDHIEPGEHVEMVAYESLGSFVGQGPP
ncbi:MAG: hypothetical protein Q8Q52_03270 [Acidimicrobiia bacterium]|nr:hypothetical protein [Acidimicrobiia bacterium]